MTRQNAAFDQNYNTTLMGVSSVDGSTPVPIEVDPTTGAVLITGSVTTGASSSTTAAVTTVGDTITSTTLIAANTNREEVEFYNNSPAILYLLKGTGTASASNYTVQLAQGDYYSSNITSAFVGVWSADSGGSVLITEST